MYTAITAALAYVIVLLLIRNRRPRFVVPDEVIQAFALQDIQIRDPYTTLNTNTLVLKIYLDESEDLKQTFRISRAAFNMLLTTLNMHRDHGWGCHLELLIFLYWLAHGVSYKVTAQVLDVPKSTIYVIIHRIAADIRRHKHKVIFFPNLNTIADVGQGFSHLAHNDAFCKAVGAIDGCHIRIKPPKNNCIDYFNYKQYYSIQMQAICNASGLFLDIFVGNPGSVHETRILKNSPVYTGALYPPPGYFLLGDGGYPCIESPITIITPFRQPLRDRTQEPFNKHHARARSVIERAFGVMKTRWRVTLFKALEVETGFCSEVVLACAFLHNICIMVGDTTEEDILPEDPGPPEPQQHGDSRETSGVHIRDRLAAQVSAPVQLPVMLRDHDYAAL